MTHRANQIVEAVASALESRVGPKGHKVFTHRKLSLASEEDQLPAHSVDFGADEPEAENTSYLDSTLTVKTTAVISAATEQDLRLALLAARREQHRAVMADPKQGLAFVITTMYGGAEEPEITEGNYEALVGTLASSWRITYRMNLTDPGDD